MKMSFINLFSVLLVQLLLAPDYINGLAPISHIKTSKFRLKMSTNQDQTNTEKLPQILSFIVPNSGVKVILLGSMHYNPVSIELAKQVVDNSAKQGKLKAVLVGKTK